MQNNLNKRRREKKRKERNLKKLESRVEKNKEKKESRKQGTNPGDLDNMLARIDHNGVIIPLDSDEEIVPSQSVNNQEDSSDGIASSDVNKYE